MKALILGVGDAFTSLHYGSSALLCAPKGPVLLDCPDPIHRVIREAASKARMTIDVNDIDDVIITHAHADHLSGLESFGLNAWVQRRKGARDAIPRLHTSRAVAARLWQRLAPGMERLAGLDQPLTLEDYFDLQYVDPGQSDRASFDIAGLTVRARFTTHYIPTLGFLFSDGSATLGWSGDTAFEQAHIDWLAQADLFVHDVSPPPAHTPIEHLQAQPDDVRRKMRLIHAPDDFDTSITDIPLLKEGDVLEI